LRGSCFVSYGKLNEMTPVLPLGGGKTFQVSETIFWSLRQIGWLYPFKATFVWEVEAKDIQP
jgi:hypothetical protein